MKRRIFLASGPAAGALAMFGPTAWAVSRKESADVVVIGSGGTGLAAGLTAQAEGAKVIVLEKMPITGGNTQLAAGGMNAADTRFQAKRSIADSWQKMFEDTMKGGKNINDPALVEVLAKNSAASVDWLSSIGADMSGVGRMAGASVDRTHRPEAGDAVGHNIVHAMRQTAIKRKLDVRTNSRVIKIFRDRGGRVTGVLVQNKFGEVYSIEAPVVILASGGFSANLARVAQYQPSYAGFSSTNQPGATGDGLDLGAEVGGKLRDMQHIQIHPTQAAGSKILITEAVRGNGAILVNRQGKRFVNELTTRDAASAAIIAQPGGTAFLILDQGVRKSLKQIEGYYHLELVREGATLEALAKSLGMDPATLAATIATYNAAQAAKKDAEFGRPDMPRQLLTGPFIAIEVKPGIHYTMGGLAINAKAQVLDRDGKPIPGLYAGGEVTGGVHGANRLGGNSISETITFGRIAGAEAAKEARATRAASEKKA
ncbi:MAG: hypothetical protein RI936_921 [Pseudomonadota bacterium]|jgi:fumarate reductase flavoprotein subunit